MEKIAQLHTLDVGLDVYEGEVVGLDIKKYSVCGVILKNIKKYYVNQQY